MSALLVLDCPHCGGAIQAPANAQCACPLCGELVIAEERRRTVSASGLRWWQLLVLVPCVFGAVMWTVMSMGQHERDKPGSAQNTNYGITHAIQPSAWDGSVSQAKDYIRREARDPDSVKFHAWKNFTNDERHITTVDLTQTNGFGGPKREAWVFSFDKKTGALMYLLVNGEERKIRY